MRATYIFCLLIVTGVVFMTSCEDYLDKAPESGLSDEDVFSKYENFMKYFDGIYTGQTQLPQRPTTPALAWWDLNIKNAHPLYYCVRDQKTTWDTYTEVADAARGLSGLVFKTGSFLPYAFVYTKWRYVPVLASMFSVIRISNMAFEKIGMLQDASRQEIDDILGQAYFIRAYANFALLRTWGPMPYITKVLGGEDIWDQERLSKYEYLLKIAADFDSAAFYFQKAGLMRRDNPVSGAPGHLTHPNMFRPNGCAALAFKGRALLYAASPLNNGGLTGQPWEKSTGEGQLAWEKAAKANWEALQAALQNGYQLLSPADYKFNFVKASYSNEQIWGFDAGATAYNNAAKQWIINGLMSANKTSNNPTCPTQNAVDRFETKWGDPLNTEADRQAAISLGHYNPQNPYKDRDPRFEIDIMYNTQNIPGYGTAKIYYENVSGVPKYSEQLNTDYAGRTYTGYYLAKYWGGESTKNRVNVGQTDPLIRLAELYLNYAEASNEAYGPNTQAPGASMTAVQAINIIRGRFNHVPVQSQFTTSKEIFRVRIKNEIFVELCYEGHHWFYNTRRWMDAPQLIREGVWGMDIEKLGAGYDPAQYPTGYRYTRVKLPDNKQPVWKDAMYYFAFELDDVQKMKNFIPNISW